MSYKIKVMKKDKSKIQIGNFLIFKESNGEYLKIETVSKNWNIRLHCSSAHFNLLTGISKDKEHHSYLEAYIKIIYCISMSFPDKQFMEEFFKSYTALNEREQERRNAGKKES